MARTTLSDDAHNQLVQLGRRIADAHTHAATLAQERDTLLRELADTGVTYDALAEAVGLTRGRVAQICGRKSKAGMT